MRYGNALDRGWTQEDGAEVISWSPHNGVNQKWSIEIVAA